MRKHYAVIDVEDHATYSDGSGAMVSVPVTEGMLLATFGDLEMHLADKAHTYYRRHGPQNPTCDCPAWLVDTGAAAHLWIAEAMRLGVPPKPVHRVYN